MSQNGPLASTTDLPYVPRFFSPRFRIVVGGAATVGVLCGILVGWKIGQTWAGTPAAAAENETSATPLPPRVPSLTPEEVRRAQARIRQGVLQEFLDAWQRGVLIVTDGHVETSEDNLPALGSMHGHTRLAYGEYPVQTYTLYRDRRGKVETFGCGVLGDPGTSLFVFVWRKGTSEPPRDPLFLELVSGRRVIAKER